MKYLGKLGLGSKYNTEYNPGERTNDQIQLLLVFTYKLYQLNAQTYWLTFDSSEEVK